jgi:hypothetical protein
VLEFWTQAQFAQIHLISSLEFAWIENFQINSKLKFQFNLNILFLKIIIYSYYIIYFLIYFKFFILTILKQFLLKNFPSRQSSHVALT